MAKRKFSPLIIIGIILMIASFIFQSFSIWLSDALSNIATGFFVSVIIYYLIEEQLEKSLNEETSNRKRIAMMRIHRPLDNLLNLFIQAYKASTHKPELFPNTYEELFKQQYFDNIKYLDFENEAPVVPKRTWTIYTAQKISNIKTQFEDAIDSYGFVLDNNIVLSIEQICSSQTFSYLQQLPTILQVDEGYGIKRNYLFYNGFTGILKNDIFLILKLLQQMNNTNQNIILNQETLFKDDVLPEWGDSRTILKLE